MVICTWADLGYGNRWWLWPSSLRARVIAITQSRRSRCGRCGGRRTKVACPKKLIKNKTIISAYASFLGNDSVTRPTSTCTIDMAHSCSFLPDKFYPTKAFSVDLVPRECRDYQGRWRLIRPHLSWIINHLNFSALRAVLLAAWPIKICFLRPVQHEEWRSYMSPVTHLPESRYGNANAYYHAHPHCIQLKWGATSIPLIFKY